MAKNADVYSLLLLLLLLFLQLHAAASNVTIVAGVSTATQVPVVTFVRLESVHLKYIHISNTQPPIL